MIFEEIRTLAEGSAGAEDRGGWVAAGFGAWRRIGLMIHLA